VAEVLVENHRMVYLIVDAGLTCRTRTDGLESEIVIQLDQDDWYLSAVGERAGPRRVEPRGRPAADVGGGGRRGRAPGSVGHAVLHKLVDGGYPARCRR
jgi:hypothetical protein